MKSLKESLFDDDLVEKDLPIDIQQATDMCMDAIAKKFHIKAYTELDFAHVRNRKEGKYLFYVGQYEDGVLDIVRIYFYNTSTKTSDEIPIGIAANICISNEDGKTAISRLDIGYVIDGDATWPNFMWNYYIWDGDEYKTKTKLSSPFFTINNTKNIIKYIENICQQVIKQSELEKEYLQNVRYTREISRMRAYPKSKSEIEKNFFL